MRINFWAWRFTLSYIDNKQGGIIMSSWWAGYYGSGLKLNELDV